MTEAIFYSINDKDYILFNFPKAMFNFMAAGFVRNLGNLGQLTPHTTSRAHRANPSPARPPWPGPLESPSVSLSSFFAPTFSSLFFLLRLSSPSSHFLRCHATISSLQALLLGPVSVSFCAVTNSPNNCQTSSAVFAII